MDCIESYINQNLTEDRKRHTYAVAEIAIKLARHYGEDEKKAKIAALFHDMYRERSMDNVNLSHGKIAADVMKKEYAIEDEDILNAVRYHTTGRAGMTKLEKIIYLADAIEPGRAYSGVDEIRELAFRSLDEACLLSLEKTIQYVACKGHDLDHDTILARDYLKRRVWMNSKEIALFAAKVLDQKKASDVVIIDIGLKSSFADYFVLASGGSERQIGTLSVEIEDRFEKEGMTVKRIEGKQTSGWILMDYGDVIINILTTEMRDRYNIEKVWGDCEQINLEEQYEQ